jgi:hypothetical protein
VLRCIVDANEKNKTYLQMLHVVVVEEAAVEAAVDGACMLHTHAAVPAVPRGEPGSDDHDNDDDSCFFSSSSSSWPAGAGIHSMFEARFCCISSVYRR